MHEEMKAEGICPRCGEACWRDSADVGIGIIYGPWGCECGWSEDEHYDKALGAGGTITDQGYLVDQWGGLTPVKGHT